MGGGPKLGLIGTLKFPAILVSCNATCVDEKYKALTNFLSQQVSGQCTAAQGQQSFVVACQGSVSTMQQSTILMQSDMIVNGADSASPAGAAQIVNVPLTSLAKASSSTLVLAAAACALSATATML